MGRTLATFTQLVQQEIDSWSRDGENYGLPYNGEFRQSHPAQFVKLLAISK
jgi:hypothetical protein